ncbi:MAG: WD40 repeat domain-containing protein [Cyclobacteriaceae bacterium]|nr:WD40 repeat domain-containing protein [Cyclobacteriaceae bacterium]
MPVSVHRLHTLAGHRDSIYALAPAGQSGVFFSAGGDGMVVQWDLTQPEEGKILAQVSNPVYALHLWKNMLIAGHNFEGIHVLDWQNKREAGSLKFTDSAVFTLQSWNDILFAGSGDGTLTAIHIPSLRIIKQVRASDKSLRCLSINSATGEMAAGYSDWHIRIFDLETLEQKHELHGHSNSVFTVRYTPSNAYLLSAGRDARIKAWSVHENYTCLGEVVAHMYAINHLEFSPDKKHFVTCSLDKSIKVWELPTLTLLKVIDRARHAGHGTSVNRLLWLNDPDYLISAGDDRTLSVWQIEVKD